MRLGEDEIDQLVGLPLELLCLLNEDPSYLLVRKSCQGLGRKPGPAAGLTGLQVLWDKNGKPRFPGSTGPGISLKSPLDWSARSLFFDDITV